MAGDTNFEKVLSATVYDSAGEKVGKAEQIYISDETDEPRWVSVKTGLFGLSKSLVPLAGAKHSGDRLEVAVTKDAIKDAPHLDSDGGTSDAEEAALLKHYGLTSDGSGWAQYGKHAAPVGRADANHRGAQAGVGTTDRSRESSDDTLVRSEERLNVGTQREEAGRARLRKYVVEEEQTVTVPVTHEEVRVVREPITDASQVSDRGIAEDSTEVILHADRVVAGKETVPVERVGLQVDQVSGEETVSDTVRKERIDTDGVTSDRDSR